MADKRILIAYADSEEQAAFREALGEGWQFTAVADGKAALAEMEKAPSQVVVADLDLPEIDGAELLNQIRAKYSTTVCFILANDADKERVMKNVLGAHQFLTKPWDKSLLKSTIERALALDIWISSNSMRELVSRVRTFPTVPSLYIEVLAALRSPNATTEQVGAIIAKDMAMMTKLLQVINSACFGLPRKITDPVEAVGILGFDTVKSMVMTIKLLNQYDKIKPVYFSIDRLWRHSTDVARSAKQLMLLETGDTALAEVAFTAGLMHDVGKVILAANFDEQYRGAQSLAKRQGIPLWEVEREIFGASHGEIGAYLLGLWGMPLDLLEVAALHHQPARSICRTFSVLTAVHVANVIEHELGPDQEGLVFSNIDHAYLESLGLQDRLSVWREAIASRESPKAESKTEAKSKSSDSPAPKLAVAAPMGDSAKPPPAPATPAGAPASGQKLPQLAWPFPEKLPRNKWAYIGAGVGTVVLLLLVGWLGVSWLTRQTIKSQTGDTGSNTTAPDDSGSDTASASTQPADTAQPTSSLQVRARSTADAPAAAKTGSKDAAYSELKLQGIFYSADDPSAIINGKTVSLNEHVGGAVVVEIGPSSVTLEYQHKRRTLTLR